jgi:hypothetical protein
MDGVAAEPEVLGRIGGRPGLDDQCGAALSGAQVLAGVVMQQGGDLRGVMGFGGGHGFGDA